MVSDLDDTVELLSPDEPRATPQRPRVSRQIGGIAIAVLGVGATLLALLHMSSDKVAKRSSSRDTIGEQPAIIGAAVWHTSTAPFQCQGAAASLAPGSGNDMIWKCQGGACIAHIGRCDGTVNCYDGSDEQGCGAAAAPAALAAPPAADPMAQVVGVGPPPGNMQEVLEMTNYYRCLHGAAPLTWDAEIAESAKSWAMQTGGAMTHSSLQYRQGVGDWRGVGENLAKGVTDAGAVDMWYNEIASTPGGQGECLQFGMTTGHYTQLVWMSTQAVGCGINGDLLVCQYGPSGNIIGAFASEVKPTLHPQPPQCVKPAITAPQNPWGPAPGGQTNGDGTGSPAGPMWQTSGGQAGQIQLPSVQIGIPKFSGFFR